MCRLRNITMHDHQENVTRGQTERQTLDKVAPLCAAILSRQHNKSSPTKLKSNLIFVVSRKNNLLLNQTSSTYLKGRQGKVWKIKHNLQTDKQSKNLNPPASK